MNNEQEIDPSEKQRSYLMATLLDYFRDPRSESNFQEASKIALNHMARISLSKSHVLQKRYIFYASRLKNNITISSLRYFVNECLEAASKVGIFAGNTRNINGATNIASLKKTALRHLSQSLAQGLSEESAAQRAANRLIKETKNYENQKKIANMLITHPLKESFEAMKTAEVNLVKEDVKSHLLRLNRNPEPNKKQINLFGLLKTAQAFSASRLHGLLGDDLFFLCKPTGFADKNHFTVIIEVPTNAHLHALTYKKLDILRALRKEPAFGNTKKIRFTVRRELF